MEITQDIRFDPPWTSIARAELGVHETPGPAATARIIEYGAATTLKPTSDEIAWCSDFQCWCMEQAGIASPKSAAALSWLHWGIDIRVPVVGGIAVFNWDDQHGHVGQIVGRGPPGSGLLAVLGGNQNDQVKISMMGTARLESIRWPGLPLVNLPAPPIQDRTR